MDNVKPVFNTNSNVASGTTTNPGTVASNPRLEGLIQERRQRAEVGAAWSRVSKVSGNKFLKLRFNRTQLVELLNRTSTSSDENVTVDFVAFPNSSSEENSKRPVYRIFESIE